MLTSEQIFKTAGTKIGKPAKSVTLWDTLSLEQWSIPSGATVKVMETMNFGFIVVPDGVKDVRGFELPKRVFRF